jgi:hypothetical protein
MVTGSIVPPIPARSGRGSRWCIGVDIDDLSGSSTLALVDVLAVNDVRVLVGVVLLVLESVVALSSPRGQPGQ